MKLKTRYEHVKNENKEWSDTNCLAVSLTEGEKYSKMEIGRVLKLCDSSDWGGGQTTRDELLDSLVRINNENMSQ